ncbi:MAG: hypothetical protein JWO95_3486 [Verrucomicrobiales bacterium]|nr:hypothetical protein [Verrucomicrobiales bacterium]
MSGGAGFNYLSGGSAERGFLARVIAGDFWKGGAQGGGEVRQRFVLFRGEVVLFVELALHDGFDELRAGRAAMEIFGADAAGVWGCVAVFVGKLSRNLDDSLAGGISFIPFVQLGDVAAEARAEVGDFDADGAAVCFGGVRGFFLRVHRLINGAVEVEHELDGEMAFKEGVEGVATGWVDGIVDDELVDIRAQQFRRPTLATNMSDLFIGQWRLAHAGGLAFLGRADGGFGVMEIVAALIGPKDNGHAGVESFAADDDFVAGLGMSCGGGDQCSEHAASGHGDLSEIEMIHHNGVFDVTRC